MDIRTLRIVFFRCFLYGMLMLVLSMLVYMVFGNMASRTHAILFGMGWWHFQKLALMGLMNMKVFIFTFFLIPAIALAVTEREQNK